MYTVYVLEDQRFTGLQAIFYVGITEDVYTRFFQHLRGKEHNIDKNERVDEIRASGVMLIMRTIETVETFGEAKNREQHWIHHYLSHGIRLLNVDIAQSFTYEDFLIKMGKSLERNKDSCVRESEEDVTQSSHLNGRRGAAAKRAAKIIKKYPGIAPMDLAKKANITGTYARKLLKQVKR